MSETAKTKLDDKTVVNTKTISKMFNMTERNVRYLVDEGVCFKRSLLVDI